MMKSSCVLCLASLIVGCGEVPEDASGRVSCADGDAAGDLGCETVEGEIWIVTQAYGLELPYSYVRAEEGLDYEITLEAEPMELGEDGRGLLTFIETVRLGEEVGEERFTYEVEALPWEGGILFHLSAAYPEVDLACALQEGLVCVDSRGDGWGAQAQ